MNYKLSTLLLGSIAIITLTFTLIHVITADVSIFHGMILHPVLLIISLSLLSILEQH